MIYEALENNKFYIKKEKCLYVLHEVSSLGHSIENRKIRIELAKMKVIMEWKAPSKVSELQLFSGHSHYDKALSLANLLNKGVVWHWTRKHQTAFEALKEVVTKEPVLALPDFIKPFEVCTDASDFTIWGVLMRDGHPIALKSRELNDIERPWPTHDKEMSAIVHCLCV